MEVKKRNIVTYFHPNNLLHLFTIPFLRNSCKMLNYAADSEDRKAEKVMHSNVLEIKLLMYKLHLTICVYKGELSYKIREELILVKYFQQNLSHMKRFHVQKMLVIRFQ